MVTTPGTPNPKIAFADAVTTGANGGFPRKKFTVADCRFLQENGLLDAGRYELIEGDIVFKMAQGLAHKLSVTLLIGVLSQVFGIFSIRNQADFGIGARDRYNDPEPDAIVLRGTARDYADHEPDPVSDVLLVAEVGISALSGDLSVKADLYARQQIREYWVIDVNGRQLHVFREPTADGYNVHDIFSDTDVVSPLAVPDAVVRVADLLP